MSQRLSLGLGLRCRSCSRCLGSIVILDVVGMALFADMFLGVVGMDESLVPYKQVASGKCFGTDFANEWLLFRVCSNMALQMFLVRLSQWERFGIGVNNRVGSTNLAKSLWQWGQGKVLFFEPELGLRFVRPPVAEVVSMVRRCSRQIRVLAARGKEDGEAEVVWREEELLDGRRRSSICREGSVDANIKH
jgi:hypothetical protein